MKIAPIMTTNNAIETLCAFKAQITESYCAAVQGLKDTRWFILYPLFMEYKIIVLQYHDYRVYGVFLFNLFNRIRPMPLARQFRQY